MEFDEVNNFHLLDFAPLNIIYAEFENGNRLANRSIRMFVSIKSFKLAMLFDS